MPSCALNRYAKSRAIEAKLYMDCYAKIASMAIKHLIMYHLILYESNRDGKEDEVVEVLMEEQEYLPINSLLQNVLKSLSCT